MLKNYSADIYEEALGRSDFPNYHNFENINDAYSNFIQKVMGVIDLVTPTVLSQGEQNKIHKNGLMMKLRKKVSVINYLGNLKTSKLHIDKEIYKK